ncbi:MAG: hypothetical protein WDO14_13435 [Bacteroidota bacterium]
MEFTFESNNPEGDNPVTKVVLYVPLFRQGRKYYNLEFGDYNRTTGRTDDLVVTDNGDMRKVLKTVASTLEMFFEDFPDKVVHIDGSNSIRRAYYHKLIKDYYNFIVPLFDVHGHTKGKLEAFQLGIEYEFIVVSKHKSLTL